MGRLLVFFGLMLGKIFPGKVISSFLGVGYLPAWQSNWSSFLALFIIDIILMLIYGGKHLLYMLPTSGIIVATVFMKVAAVMLVVQVIGIFAFHAKDPGANSGENIVVQIATGQVLTVGCSMPAIISIYYSISKLYGDLCKQMLQCPFWFNDFMHFLFFLMIPYVFFNIAEVIKPWPINSIQVGYNNAISISFEGILYAFYAAVLMYLIAFILCDLTMSSAIAFNTTITHQLQADFIALKGYLYSVFKK
ncbi:phosphatidylglycerophosphatase [Wolbachia endosymbiont of Chironomus riparius]|uniref:phosphatidylglycerophosphatase n=1 Tax=Wolbachia endosymbiont of Chironomus riparius TaxID=2883238 RepID=UPI00209F8662|nr:phosphatidylglycerophosphatase [Wolbachia endosymbiont of Chironomus riparius]